MSFETNGVYVDEKHWNDLSHLHKYPMNFTITPNSFDKYTYRYLSGGIDDLEKCKESLKFVSNLRKEGKIASFKIDMVVQEANYWEIPAFIKYCLDEYDPDIIHDDASTDGTQSILREYEEAYPGVFRIIYQKEN